MEVLTTVGEQVGCVLVLARMSPRLWNPPAAPNWRFPPSPSW